MPTIVCMKWGTAFPAVYVNRLYRGVRRHAPANIPFVCFTDDPTGLEPGIEARAIPPIRLPAIGMRGGPWRKLALWSSEIGLEGDVLFLDLDVVITGSLVDFFSYQPGRLCLIRNWTQPWQSIGNSSVMRFAAASAPHLVSDFERDAVALSFKHTNEQTYLTRHSRLPTAFWPTGWCASFKHDVMPWFPRNLWVEAHLPTDARIVVFTGHPRPHEAANGEWPSPWYKRPYKSLRPVRWIDEMWR